MEPFELLARGEAHRLEQEQQEALDLRSTSRRRASKARRCRLHRPPSRSRQGRTHSGQTWRMLGARRGVSVKIHM